MIAGPAPGVNPLRTPGSRSRTAIRARSLRAASAPPVMPTPASCSGFTSIQITTTQDAEPGLHSAIIQATRPA
jgi:hypothetical protein